jgi:hypothetical protein
MALPAQSGRWFIMYSNWNNNDDDSNADADADSDDDDVVLQDVNILRNLVKKHACETVWFLLLLFKKFLGARIAFCQRKTFDHI